MADEIRDIDKTVAFILELIGIFGILGIGYMYAGLIKEGVIRLVLWIIILFVAWMVVLFMSMFYIGFCMMPLLMIAQVGVPIWSGFRIKKRLDESFPNSK